MGTEGWVSKPALFRPVKNRLSGSVHRRGVGPMVAGASSDALGQENHGQWVSFSKMPVTKIR